MLQLLYVTIGQLNYSVYQAGQLQSDFAVTRNYHLTCSIPPLQVIYRSENDSFIVPVNVQLNDNIQHSINYTVHNILDNNYHEFQQTNNLTFTDNFIFNIDHQCPDSLNNNDYWGLIYVEMYIDETQADFYYISNCDQKYKPIKFDYSYLIILTVGTLVVYLFSRFGIVRVIDIEVKRETTRSVNNFYQYGKTSPFQGIYLNYWYFIWYLLAVVILLTINYLNEDAYKYILVIISLFLNMYFIDEIFAYFRIFKKRLLCLRLCDYLGMMIGCVPTICYFIWSENWIVIYIINQINDIISLLNLGAFLKLFKVTSYKDSVTLYVPFLVLALITDLYVYYAKEFKYGTYYISMSQNILTLQAPLYWFQVTKRCAIIEFNTFFLPGLMIAYTYRYGKSKGVYVYFIIYLLSLLFGLLLWLSTTFTNSEFMMPSLFFTLIPPSVICILLSYKRNEQNYFWRGFFYDVELLDPFNSKMKKSMGAQNELVVEETMRDQAGTIHRSATIHKQLFHGLQI